MIFWPACAHRQLVSRTHVKHKTAVIVERGAQNPRQQQGPTTTTTQEVTMPPGTPPSRPSDLFSMYDHIEVTYAKSKHYRRTGVITRISNPRLTVRFDDGHPGNYVDYRYARVIPDAPRRTNLTNTSPRNINITDVDLMATVSEDRGDEETNSVTALMENLAIQTAVTTLAGSNNMADVERAINEQATRIRIQARRILQRRSNNEGT
jgi:hypothetical protein